MKKIVTFLLLILLSHLAFAQFQKASMSELFEVQTEKVGEAIYPTARKVFEPLDGFPLVAESNATFKNVRNLTLADLNEDGHKDLIFAGDEFLYAYAADDVLWAVDMEATSTYPPSVADLDGDGEIEIVQAAFGGFNDGRLYVLDKAGNVKSGFPIIFEDKILTAATLSDLDDDGDLEILVNERDSPAGKLHVFNHDGTIWSDNFPAFLDKTPAITPSVGDLDGDGEKEIVVFSTESRHVIGLDGQPKAGWPISNHPTTRFSFHSPALADLDNNQTLQIIGSTTGDDPEFYVLNADATYRDGWAIDVPGNSWTFSPPTVVNIEGDYRIFMSRPIGVDANDMFYAWDKDGNLLDGFPIVKQGGLEGYISVADVDGDDAMELIFGSNLLDTDGFGFIHAYEMDGTGEVAGFPIRPYGWTFMNGVSFDDIDGNGSMDLVALTYTNSFGERQDSVLVHAYDLEVPFAPEKVLWNTYKGSNSRDGLVERPLPNSTIEVENEVKLDWSITPNPITDIAELNIHSFSKEKIKVVLYDVNGQQLKVLYNGDINNVFNKTIHFQDLENGIYFIKMASANFLETKKIAVFR